MLRKALFSWSYFLIFNVTATTALPYSDTYPKNPNIDILHYSFSLNLSDTTDVIRAKATITFLLKKEGINKLRLDLIKKYDSGLPLVSITYSKKKSKKHNELV